MWGFGVVLVLVLAAAMSSDAFGLGVGKHLQQMAKLGRGTMAAATLAVAMAVTPVHAAAPGSDVNVYFGVGCFWHVQHEFVETEKKVLTRDDNHITSKAGYAGGLSVGKVANRLDNKEGIVCYHNLLGKGDYGQLGYGEVVGMDIPAASVRQFADEYFSLFGKDLERPDKGDRGPEYRSLLGLPGGVNSPLYAAVKEAADARGLALLEGKGNDPDTLGKRAVFVMDTAAFPFRQAEVYHQFHDGFMAGEQYGALYHGLQAAALKDGRLHYTGCPDTTL